MERTAAEAAPLPPVRAVDPLLAGDLPLLEGLRRDTFAEHEEDVHLRSTARRETVDRAWLLR